mgnify:CR=1 FL=1
MMFPPLASLLTEPVGVAHYLVVGAVLATVGISQYVASKPPERALSFQLGPTNGGAFGMLRGAF